MPSGYVVPDANRPALLRAGAPTRPAKRRHQGRAWNAASSMARLAAASLAAIRSAVVLSTSTMSRSPRSRSRSKSAR